MRVFKSLAPIVVLMQNVIYDLRIFMLFYVILLAIFCQTFAVLGLGNDFHKYEEEVGHRMLKPSPKGGGGGGKNVAD